MNDLDELCLLSYLCMMYTCDGINIHERKKVWEDKKESTREKETMRKNINKKNIKISRVLSTTYDGEKKVIEN